jgi:NADPH:quinone reductase-like Zn-dependent oxidoreductase
MKAIRYTQYGSPDVLRLADVDQPVPGENEVLVQVVAASANPLDWHFMRGAPFIARLSGGWFKPTDPRLGVDIAGQVVAAGSAVQQYRPGDAVFGVGVGGFAEYAVARADRLALKPAKISFTAAAAAPVAALTSLQGLRDSGHVRPGEKVLVNGGAGGVGTFAVQMARAFGAEVTAVCSLRNQAQARAIGAAHSVDYACDDFTRGAERYDLIFDAVGNRSVADLRRALAPQGRCVVAGFTSLPRLFEHAIIGPLLSRKGGQRVGLMGTATPNAADMDTIKEMLESGQVVSVVEQCYPLNETAAAMRYLESGHVRGKLVIRVAADGE